LKSNVPVLADAATPATGNAGAPPVRSRVRLDIDLRKLRANYRRLAQAVAPLKVMAVLKANAYGLGVQPIAQALADEGVLGFGVAEVREALAIKHLGKPVQVLGGLIDEEIPVVVREGIVAAITDLRVAELLSAEAVRQGKSVDCHFKIDTGMGRLGILLSEAESVITRAVKLPGLNCCGIYSHFPFAYGDYAFTYDQLADFRRLLESLRPRGIAFKWVHMANSDGINNIPESVQAPFNLARTGINLYGVFDLDGKQRLDLEPVLSLTARLVAVREMPRGATIGYGRTFVLKRNMRIGTVAIGYADGLPLGASNQGHVLIRGRECPIVGRISMDYTTVSLENVPEATVGDDVVCLGDGITVGEWAKAKGTIVYEIICAIGNRVERHYLD
jgi:alanine racemase